MTRGEQPPDPNRPVQRRIRAYYRTVSRFIDRELSDRRDLELWTRIADEHRGGRALDLGCGTGRVTAILAERVGCAVGIDLSVPMLVRARSNPLSRFRSGDAGFALVAGDVRRVGFTRAFDLVTAANDPFVHLSASEDRDRALDAVVSHLAPGGRFVLDAHWFPPDQLERALDPDGLESEHGGRHLLVRERWWCTADGRCRARYEYRRAGELLDRAELSGRYWTVDELRLRFERAGLEVTALWGDYDLSPWDAATSRHLVVEGALAERSGRFARRSM